MPVRVDCDDHVGSTFCYQLQEGIIASRQFKLVSQAPSWVIHAVTQDAMHTGTGSLIAVGVTITWDPATGLPEHFETLSVSSAGSEHVQQIVPQVLSELSEQVNVVRRAAER